MHPACLQIVIGCPEAIQFMWHFVFVVQCFGVCRIGSEVAVRCVASRGPFDVLYDTAVSWRLRVEAKARCRAVLQLMVARESAQKDGRSGECRLSVQMHCVAFRGSFDVLSVAAVSWRLRVEAEARCRAVLQLMVAQESAQKDGRSGECRLSLHMYCVASRGPFDVLSVAAVS